MMSITIYEIWEFHDYCGTFTSRELAQAYMDYLDECHLRWVNGRSGFGKTVCHHMEIEEGKLNHAWNPNTNETEDFSTPRKVVNDG